MPLILSGIFLLARKCSLTDIRVNIFCTVRREQKLIKYGKDQREDIRVVPLRLNLEYDDSTEFLHAIVEEENDV